MSISRERDRDAFDRLAREHAPAIHRLAFRLAGPGGDAEDLVQETFLRAWKGIWGFRGDAGVRTWLVRILLNVSNDRRRRRTTALRKEPYAVPDPAEGLARRELLGLVLDAVHALPRRQCEALLLRARGGLAYRRIAGVMGIKEVAVKSHLAQARRRLVRRFGKEIEEWGIT